jgi:hypothetical protein
MKPEILVAHVTTPVPASLIRSTLLRSSLELLRARGYYDRYIEALDPRHRETLLGSLAPVWIPIEPALAHYAACDAMNLSVPERVALGEAVGDRVQGPLTQALIQGARTVGVTPLTLFARFDTLWGRVLLGGSAQVTKLGPKDVSVELLKAQIPRYAYCRTAITGIFRLGLKIGGARTAYISPGTYDERDDRFIVRAAWV